MECVCSVTHPAPLSGRHLMGDEFRGRGQPRTVQELTQLGRVRLSKHFYMREFLFSEIAAIHGILNAPDDPNLAIAAGRKLCEELLEPLQACFGRIVVRSAYRNRQVNNLGWQRMRAGEFGYNCSSNKRNAAHHIWDEFDDQGCMGATACIVIPGFNDRWCAPGDWQRLAWFIHDTLPYSAMRFFRVNGAFNIAWHERPKRRIDSYVEPRGCLTRPGLANNTACHREDWKLLLNNPPSSAV